jgi:chromosome partitioning protein
VENVVRKLLVASQKGGVGKTTTSINLAAATAMAGTRVLLLDADPLSSISSSLNLPQHPNRQPLRREGIDLPGVICCGVIPGLDVISPYDEGGCSDEDLDELLRLIATPAFEECYGCLVVDSPPFMGARPTQLLSTCDEFILVMRAEPLAYRTLPAFLEIVQRARRGGATIEMRGILLTLPESEGPGGRWERELRGRFGSRILPQVIPHDEEVEKALLFGHVVTHASPESPASVQYHELVELLDLARESQKGHTATVEETLFVAASTRAAEITAASATAMMEIAAPPARTGSGTIRRPGSGLKRRDPAHLRPVPQYAPPSGDDSGDLGALDFTEPQRPAADSPRAPASPSRTSDVAPPTPNDEVPELTPETPLVNSRVPWLIWVGLADVAGVGLRFVELPRFALPVVVGIATAAAVTLGLRLFQANGDQTAEESEA